MSAALLTKSEAQRRATIYLDFHVSYSLSTPGELPLFFITHFHPITFQLNLLSGFLMSLSVSPWYLVLLWTGFLLSSEHFQCHAKSYQISWAAARTWLAIIMCSSEPWVSALSEVYYYYHIHFWIVSWFHLEVLFSSAPCSSNVTGQIFWINSSNDFTKEVTFFSRIMQTFLWC